MNLRTSTFTPSTFTPSTYTHQQSDYSILQNSFERNEQRSMDAQNAFNKLVDLMMETAKLMPPSEKDWFNSYSDSICKLVDKQIQIGNSQSATRLSNELISQVHRNKNIQYRIDSYKQYCDDMLSHGLYNYQNGRVTQTVYEWFCITNPYKFIPKYDTNGILSGYYPVYISYLYPSINWNEVYQFVTSQGLTKSDINRMWSLYFSIDKLSSLEQEFNVTKFYYYYFTSISDNSDFTQGQKEQLMSDIKKFREILSDSNNQISYDAFVENLKNQYVMQTPRTKSNSSLTKRNIRRKK